MSPYSAGKGGGIGFTRTLALEVAGSGVTANTLAIGLMGMPDPSMTAALARSIPVGRTGEAGDIAAACMWLASDEAAWVTGQTIVVDLPADAPLDVCLARLAELHDEYRREYRAYYDRHATPDSPAMRRADPAIVLVPGVGTFSYGPDKQTARVAGEFNVNAINVMRGAEALSTYAPIPESEKFRIEYWALEEAKLRRRPAPLRHAGRIALVTGAASGIGKAVAAQLAADGACVVVADLDGDRAAEVAGELGGPDVAVGLAADVTDAVAVRAVVDATLLAFGGLDLVVNNAGLSISKPLLDTTEADWDVQHDVMAKGSFLVARAAAEAMIAQGSASTSSTSSRRTRSTRARATWPTGRPRPTRLTRCGCWPSSLASTASGSTASTPTASCGEAGSLPEAGAAQRAATYGVPEDELGASYAQRTLLKREVLPEHVARAVAAVCSDELSHTTGLLVPVDAGVAAAFVR